MREVQHCGAHLSPDSLTLKGASEPRTGCDSASHGEVGGVHLLHPDDGIVDDDRER